MADGIKKPLFVSHRTLRVVVGVLGMALPAVVAVWGFALCECLELQDSISDYYSLRTRDAFVGILFVIAWFMFAYKGYEDDANDDFAGNLVCIFALGVALFPNSGTDWEQIVHFSSAIGLFGTLSYFSLVLFRKSGGSQSQQKMARNKVYLICGLVIVASLVLIGLAFLLLDDDAITATKVVFVLETVMLLAFGVSWFVKGETLLKDPT